MENLDLGSLASTSALLAFAANIMGSVLKKWVYPRFGSFGVQAVVFATATIGAWYFLWGQHIPSLAWFAASAVALFSLAVAFYEVILKRIDVFKGTSTEVEVARTQAND